MRCELIRERLIAPFDFQDTAAEAEDIRGHLENCPACREIADRLDRLADLLNETTVPPVPEGLAGRVLAVARRRLVANGTMPPSFGGWHRRWDWKITPARLAAAATLLVGLSLGGVMSWQTWPSPDIQPIATEPETRDPLALYSTALASDANGGSLTDGYLALLSGPNGRGE
ncbi:MAG: hypothetical protein HY000_36685 [Planctomycetes bacterium]|nr:hypothetical protein [Planctomycetota bacterium]